MALTKEYNSFFKQLTANNSTEWFNANKKKYEQHVKEPFHQLVQEVIDRMKKIDPGIKMEPKESVYRLNRDVRFSNDKNPYKTFMAAVVSRGGKNKVGCVLALGILVTYYVTKGFWFSVECVAS